MKTGTTFTYIAAVSARETYTYTVFDARATCTYSVTNGESKQHAHTVQSVMEQHRQTSAVSVTTICSQ